MMVQVSGVTKISLFEDFVPAKREVIRNTLLQYDSDKDTTMVWEQSSFVCISDLLTKQGCIHPRGQYIVAPNALHPCIAAIRKKPTIKRMFSTVKTSV